MTKIINSNDPHNRATGNIGRELAKSFDDFARDYAATFASRLGTFAINSLPLRLQVIPWNLVKAFEANAFVSSPCARESSIRTRYIGPGSSSRLLFRFLSW